MKKLLTAILSSALLLCAVLPLAACGEDEGCTHTWGEWEIITEADCTVGGEKTRSCTLCGEVDRVYTYPTAHTYSEEWSYDANYHWHESTCIHTDKQSAYAPHNRDGQGVCQTCGHIRATQGVELDVYAYVITGRGDGNEENIVLGRTYYDYPIIGVADGAFRGEEGITSVIAQDNMKFIGNEAFADITTLKTVELYAGLESIGSRAFAGLTSLETITFHGTRVEWDAIEKSDDWDADSADYEIIFTEGLGIRLPHGEIKLPLYPWEKIKK